MKNTIKTLIAIGIVILIPLLNTYAGDVAVYSDLGFSADGNYYLFSQYGKEDKTYCPYADLFVVDIKKNDFAANGVFHTLAKNTTPETPSRTVYNALLDKASYVIKQYSPTLPTIDQVLYIRDSDKKGGEQIEFSDFSNYLDSSEKHSFRVLLTSEVNGKGINALSSFFITLETLNSQGEVILKKIVGSPNIKRKSVTSYKIEKIVFHPTSRAIVFIIEKSVEDEAGVSIRYMLEASTLD